MKDSTHKQLYSRLNLKDTEELLEIWHNHDTDEWIDEVFEVTEEILVERLGELPSRFSTPQDESETGESPSRRADDETVFHETLDDSSAMEQLDQALWYAYDDEPEKALAACEVIKPVLPDIAEAWNYLGIIYDTLGEVELAIDAYIKAVQADSQFSSARKNLRNARVRLEGEQYHCAANLTPEETRALSVDFDQLDDSEIIEREEPIPGWYYLDETAYLLPGWPGYRTRPGRSGYDQLDTEYELAHIEGVIVRKLITCTMRTRNPMQLLFMIFLGLIFCIPLLFVLVMLLEGDFRSLFTVVLFTPYWVVGVMLLVNVFLSLVLDDSTEPDNEDVFF
jgi:tetratricopeptide (TPR) repeat protein